jgi:hypothetical protein
VEVYENRKVYSRKVGKLTPKEYNELGHSVAKKLIPAIFKNKDGFYYDFDEFFTLGDVKVYKDENLFCVVEFEIRDDSDFNKIINYKWCANILQKNGLRDLPKLVSRYKLQDENEVHSKFFHFILGLSDAINCKENGKLPELFGSFKYTKSVCNLNFRLETSVDANGVEFSEFKAKLPYRHLTQNILDPSNINYKQGSYEDFVDNI